MPVRTSIKIRWFRFRSRMMRKFYFIFFLCVPLFACGQVKLIVRSCSSDGASLQLLLKSLKTGTAFSDTTAAKKELNRIVIALCAQGYLSATIDTITADSTTVTACLATGKIYEWAQLNRGNVDEGVLRESGFREKVYSGKPVRPASLAGIQEKLLGWYENNGYPFAAVGLKNVSIGYHSITASLHADKGAYILIDSILVKGNAKISTAYLQNYLALRTDRPYHEALIARIPNRIKELPMVSELRPPAVSFSGTKASVYLYLENKKASQLDGVVGILPDNSGNGKITVTGDVHLRLLSAFGAGELFDFSWKQPLPKTQDLKVKFNYPFLFSTPFGIDLGISIYKKDTSWTELNRTAGLLYQLIGGNNIRAFYNNKKSTLLNTKAYESATVLPPFADISLNSYGLGLRLDKTDYRLNPRSGFSMDISASAGKKNIEKNIRLKNIDYDSLTLQSTQYHAAFSADVYFPLFSRNVLNIGTVSGLLSGNENFENEMFRIGGLKTLRGFDEEAILASAYAIWKTEVRYLVEQNSYLFLFVNGAWYERKQRNYFITDTPIGFGAGITFETKLGIFSLNYALGKEFSNPILLRTGKVHFGIVNYF